MVKHHGQIQGIGRQNDLIASPTVVWRLPGIRLFIGVVVPTIRLVRSETGLLFLGPVVGVAGLIMTVWGVLRLCRPDRKWDLVRFAFSHVR